MRPPRILPLVAIAAAGVLAINAVENGPGIYGAARALAEGVTKHAPAAAASALPPDTNAAASPDQQAVAAKPAPICAESPEQLAKDAGLSPAELQVIQSLGARRGELDQREAGLDTQLALIQAAEAKVDDRIATMNALKGDMQGMLGQLNDKQQAEVARLVKVYSAMDPQAAAERFVLLTDDVRLPIAELMKERTLSAMIAKMPPAESKRLTESLAARYVAQAQAVQNAITPPLAQAANTPPPAAPAAKTPPAQAAATPPAATPSAATPPGAQAAATPPKPVVHRKPKPKPAAPALAAGAPPSATPSAATPGASAAAKPSPAPAAAPSSAPPAAAPPPPAASAAAPAKSG